MTLSLQIKNLQLVFETKKMVCKWKIKLFYCWSKMKTWPPTLLYSTFTKIKTIVTFSCSILHKDLIYFFVLSKVIYNNRVASYKWNILWLKRILNSCINIQLSINRFGFDFIYKKETWKDLDVLCEDNSIYLTRQ